jgi:hypothetical protein
MGQRSVLINAVVSMGQRNTRVEPDLHSEQWLNRSLGLDPPEHYPG